jgi:hypothetical protein
MAGEPPEPSSNPSVDLNRSSAPMAAPRNRSRGWLAALIALVVALGGFLGSLDTIGTWLGRANKRLEAERDAKARPARERAAEYERLAALRPGVAVQKYVKALGQPDLQRRVQSGLSERVWLRRLAGAPVAFVLARSSSDGPVQLLAIIGLDKRFNPTFIMPSHTTAHDDTEITLNRTSLAAAMPDGYMVAGWPSGDTFKYYLEATGGSHAADFQYHIVGFTELNSEVMPPEFTSDVALALMRGNFQEFRSSKSFSSQEYRLSEGFLAREDVKALRRALSVNIYAITAPRADLHKVGLPLLKREDINLLLPR